MTTKRTYQVTHRFDLEMLARIDKVAEREGLSRSQVINRVLREGIDGSEVGKKLDEILTILKKK